MTPGLETEPIPRAIRDVIRYEVNARALKSNNYYRTYSDNVQYIQCMLLVMWWTLLPLLIHQSRRLLHNNYTTQYNNYFLAQIDLHAQVSDHKNWCRVANLYNNVLVSAYIRTTSHYVKVCITVNNWERKRKKPNWFGARTWVLGPHRPTHYCMTTTAMLSIFDFFKGIANQICYCCFFGIVFCFWLNSDKITPKEKQIRDKQKTKTDQICWVFFYFLFLIEFWWSWLWPKEGQTKKQVNRNQKKNKIILQIRYAVVFLFFVFIEFWWYETKRQINKGQAKNKWTKIKRKIK